LRHGLTRYPSRLASHVLVLGAVLLVHGPSVAFGFTGLDDQDLLGDDAAFLRGPVSLLRIFARSYMHVVDAHHPYYRPLVTASFALDAHWPGASPIPYHATNVLVHACASLLFLGLLRRFAMGAAATAGALLFAVHPTLASAVAWIPGRNDSLLALFVLAAWRFLPFDGLGPSGAQPRLGDLGLHLAFFALALLAKETALVAPAVWTLHVALQARPDPANRRRITWIVLPLGWLVLVAARLALASAPVPPVGARDGAFFLSLLVRSLGPLVLPLNPALLSDKADLPLASGVAVLALVATAAALVPGVRMRVVAIGAAAYAGFALPGLFAGATLLLTTRLYLPACGALLVATEALRALFDRAAAKRPAMSFAFVTAAAFAFLSLAYEGTFANRRRFARAETEASPHCAMAHFCLGASCQMDGDDGRAMAEYQSALALGAVEVVHNNIAVIEMGRGEWLAAEVDLRREIAVNPGYARALRNLAIVLRHEGRDADAADAEARASTLEGAPGR
jgi:protein O-mannosyl-transferase